jgi:hypothetical protein
MNSSSLWYYGCRTPPAVFFDKSGPLKKLKACMTPS